MNKEPVNDKNFLLFCAKHYDQALYHSTDEFVEDMNRIKYIKKLVTRYQDSGDLKERLILNHIIILSNCFGPEILCKILYLKLFNQMHCIKPFLILLNVLPERLYNVGEHPVIETDLTAMDDFIVSKLRRV